MLSPAIEKIEFFLFKKTIYGSFRQEIAMGKCKTKFRYIDASFPIFRQLHTYSGINQAYSGIFRTLYIPGIFRTLAYSDPWYIHNPYIFNTLVYLEP